MPNPSNSDLVGEGMPDDLTHYMRKCSELAQQLEQAREERLAARTALRRLDSLTSDGHAFKDIIRAALTPDEGAER